MQRHARLHRISIAFLKFSHIIQPDQYMLLKDQSEEVGNE